MSQVPALVISARDNVATALQPLEAGQVITLGNQSITVAEQTPRGHKIALQLIRKGEDVVKYGSTIGTATEDIPPGAHVHTHNVASGRGRGDLQPRNNTDEHGFRPRNNTDEHGLEPRNNTDEHGLEPRNNTDEHGLQPRNNTDEHGSMVKEVAAEDPRIAEPPDLSPVTGNTVQ